MLIQSNQENQKSLSLAQVCSLQNGSNIESLTEVPTLSLSLRKFQLYFSPFTYLDITCCTVLLFLGKGGRVASGISLSQFVSKNLAVKNLDDSNPRESILRHAKVSVTYRFCPRETSYGRWGCGGGGVMPVTFSVKNRGIFR